MENFKWINTLISNLSMTATEIRPQLFSLCFLCKNKMFALNQLNGFREKNFHIQSNIKIMSNDWGHLGWRSRSSDIILKFHHPRTIHSMFDIQVPEKKIFNIFPIKQGPMLKLCQLMSAVFFNKKKLKSSLWSKYGKIEIIFPKFYFVSYFDHKEVSVQVL